MPTIKLTQAAVERLKPPAAGRVEYWDSQCPGFGLRVSAPARGRDGRKTWQIFYRVKGGRLVRETIGSLAAFPAVKDARERARESLQKAAEGINPVAARRQRQAEEAAAPTVSQAIDRYLAEYARDHMRLGYYDETERALRVDVVPAIGGLQIDQLTKATIRAKVIAPIVARGKRPHASHVLSYLRAFLSWAGREDIIAGNPAIGIPDPDPRKKEDRECTRYLDDSEIPVFWRACNKIGWPFGPLFKLLLLTGARRDELAQATWAEFPDLDKRTTWTLPRERSKNGKEHVTWLSDEAVKIIESLPTYEARTGYLFTTTGSTPVSGFGRARERLAAEMPGVPPFTLHDLRRTFASGCAELGVSEHIVDRCLNHSGRKVSGVARIYNRSEYLPQRQAALDLWSRHVAALTGPHLAANKG